MKQSDSSKPMRIIYHGTKDKASARAIIKDGFRPGTYFAIHQEDALAYGGNYVFEVAVQANKIPKGIDWEWSNDEAISRNGIVSLTQHPAKKIINNQELRELVAQSNTPSPDKPRIAIGKISIHPMANLGFSDIAPKQYTKRQRVSHGVYADKGSRRITRKRRRGWRRIY